MNDFDKDALGRTLHHVYDRGENLQHQKYI